MSEAFHEFDVCLRVPGDNGIVLVWAESLVRSAGEDEGRLSDGSQVPPAVARSEFGFPALVVC